MQYKSPDIEFQYPDGWQITDEEAIEWPRSVSVQSPQGAFWSVLLYDSQAPAELTDEVLASMRDEYDDLEFEELSETIDGVRLAGYDMYFCCLDLVVHARTLAARLTDRTVLLLWQAEDRDDGELEQVFRAITTSFFWARADEFKRST